jgi:hypothetical protein
MVKIFAAEHRAVANGRGWRKAKGSPARSMVFSDWLTSGGQKWGESHNAACIRQTSCSVSNKVTNDGRAAV